MTWGGAVAWARRAHRVAAALALLAVLACPAHAQHDDATQPPQGGTGVAAGAGLKVGGLPAAAGKGRFAIITDGTSATDCTTGTGTTGSYVPCYEGASAWFAGSGGAGAPISVNYIVQASDATLTAERVATNSLGLSWGFGAGDPGTATVAFVYTNTLASNPTFASPKECIFSSESGGGGFICEGTAADLDEVLYTFPSINPADGTYRIAVDNAEVTNLEGNGLSITTGTLNVADAGPATKGIVQLAYSFTGTATQPELESAVAGKGLMLDAVTNPNSLAFYYASSFLSSPTLGVGECLFNADGVTLGGFFCEGSVADANEQRYLFPWANGADTTHYFAFDDDQNVTEMEGTALIISAGTLNVALAQAGVHGVIELDSALGGSSAAVELAAAVAGLGLGLNTTTAPDSLAVGDGAGINVLADTIETASTETGFLTDGEAGTLSCTGAGTEGRAQVNNDGTLSWCDGSGTLRFYNPTTAAAPIDAQYIAGGVNSILNNEQVLTALAGIALNITGGNGGNAQLSTASTEAAFLTDGAAVSLTCGASAQGKMQVLDSGALEYCDGATTSVLKSGFLDADGIDDDDPESVPFSVLVGAAPYDAQYVVGGVNSILINEQVLTGLAGITVNITGGDGGTAQIATASQEALFLADGAAANLTCGASNQGKIQVMDGGALQYCDGAVTSLLKDGYLDADGIDDDDPESVPFSVLVGAAPYDAQYIVGGVNSILNNEQVLVALAGLALNITGGDGGNAQLSTASTEAAFLTDGAAVSLTCGASAQGKMQVMDDGALQYCDGAATSVLKDGYLDADGVDDDDPESVPFSVLVGAAPYDAQYITGGTNSILNNEQVIVALAGLALNITGGDGGNAQFSTASTEAAFLTDGGVTALTCGASAGGKMQVMDDGRLQYCDGAATSGLVSGFLDADGSDDDTPETADFTNLTGGAGIGHAVTGTLTTASTEAGFLTDGGVGALTCGASNQGKMQVQDDGTLTYCDGATTSVARSLSPGGTTAPIDAQYIVGGVNSILNNEQVIVGLAGIALNITGGDGGNAQLSTASQEAAFLADGAAASLTCGASAQGKMQVMDDGALQYCDGATTSLLKDGYLDADGIDDDDPESVPFSVLVGAAPYDAQYIVGGVNSILTNEQALVALAGLALNITGGDGGNAQLSTASTEAAFLTDGAAVSLTCGASNQGKMQVMDGGALQYCDGAATSLLKDGYLDADGIDDDDPESVPFANVVGVAPYDAQYITGGTNSILTNEQVIVGLAGIAVNITGGDGGNAQIATASTEAAFLTDGGVTSLTCGASNQGKMQVMDGGALQYCDGAVTSLLVSGYVVELDNALAGTATAVELASATAGLGLGMNTTTTPDSMTVGDGAGINVLADTIETQSEEAGFLNDGGVTSLTCGASNAGKMQVMDDGKLQYCDGATTSVLKTLDPAASGGDVKSDGTVAMTGTLNFTGSAGIAIGGTAAVALSSTGTAGVPQLTITGDSNTGLYSSGADQVGLTTGGGTGYFDLTQTLAKLNVGLRLWDGTNNRVDLQGRGGANGGLLTEAYTASTSITTLQEWYLNGSVASVAGTGAQQLWTLEDATTPTPANETAALMRVSWDNVTAASEDVDVWFVAMNDGASAGAGEQDRAWLQYDGGADRPTIQAINATNNAVADGVRLAASSSAGTAVAANFGTRVAIGLENSTGGQADAAAILAQWIDPVSPSYDAGMSLMVQIGGTLTSLMDLSATTVAIQANTELKDTDASPTGALQLRNIDQRLKTTNTSGVEQRWISKASLPASASVGSCSVNVINVSTGNRGDFVCWIPEAAVLQRVSCQNAQSSGTGSVTIDLCRVGEGSSSTGCGDGNVLTANLACDTTPANNACASGCTTTINTANDDLAENSKLGVYIVSETGGTTSDVLQVFMEWEYN